MVFDLKFQRPQSPAEDEEFAQGIRAFGQVFLVKGRNRKDGPEIGSTKPFEDLPLQKNLEEAALGVAPFPLPRAESRVSQVWAFHDDDATLPAVALHGTVSDRWLKLLSDAGLQIGGSSLDANTPLSSELTHNLRLAFKNDPMFANSVRQKFQQELSGGIGETASTAMLDALIRLYEGPDNFYLNFYGPPGTVPTIPYYRLVSGDGPPVDCLDFRGKTVFVGLSELTKPVTEDHFPTVFDRDDGVHMSGVEIAATAFANMLKNQSLQPAGPGLRALILFTLGVVITVCSLMLPAGYALALAIAVAAGYAVAVQTAL